nr:FAD-dependent oxidoreductase [Nitratireductor aestuarii]
MGRAEQELPLSARSMEIWRDMDRKLGSPTGYGRTGIMYVAYTDADEQHWTTWHEIGKRHGVVTHELSGATVAAKLPGRAAQPACGPVFASRRLRGTMACRPRHGPGGTYRRCPRFDAVRSSDRQKGSGQGVFGGDGA